MDYDLNDLCFDELVRLRRPSALPDLPARRAYQAKPAASQVVALETIWDTDRSKSSQNDTALCARGECAPQAQHVADQQFLSPPKEAGARQVTLNVQLATGLSLRRNSVSTLCLYVSAVQRQLLEVIIGVSDLPAVGQPCRRLLLHRYQ
ncbi:hypothetical protein [Mesorhizobium sp. LNJC394B00]|uniref:hypothetical protein n=1 Tax=Mesorhizobium sp. LNJC394B00 TaxID=1287274 RepID=UPI0012EC82F8|nr:hypothetical protein [Mesorhizobium sp. LNJC394B00]